MAKGSLSWRALPSPLEVRLILRQETLIQFLVAALHAAVTHFFAPRLLVFSCAYIVLVLFKGLGLAWLPLLVLVRSNWQALLYLGVITLILNGVVLEVAGIEVYKRFFSILPFISVPVGQGLTPTILHDFGFYPHLLYTFLYLAGLGLLYYGFLRNGEAGWALNGKRSPLITCAFLAGTLALFCLFNNVSHEEYGPSYLFFPLLGWMMQEGNLASCAWAFGDSVGPPPFIRHPYWERFLVCYFWKLAHAVFSCYTFFFPSKHLLYRSFFSLLRSDAC